MADKLRAVKDWTMFLTKKAKIVIKGNVSVDVYMYYHAGGLFPRFNKQPIRLNDEFDFYHNHCSLTKEYP